MFDKYLYPGYTNRKALDQKSFPCNDALIYVFCQEEKEEKYEIKYEETNTSSYPIVVLDSSKKNDILEDLQIKFTYNLTTGNTIKLGNDNKNTSNNYHRKRKQKGRDSKKDNSASRDGQQKKWRSSSSEGRDA